jgi:phosphoribosylglycinamide formyltransferase-1
MSKKIALFASGSGSNAENITRFFSQNSSIEVVCIVTNNKNAYVLERAGQLGIPTAVFPNSEWKSAENILPFLSDQGVDYIVLAGFLLRIPEALLHVYPHKIINIHPALLPKHGGKGMYGGHVHQAVVDAGERESGITIHYINENYDEGSIIFQATCPVLPTDSAEDVATKVHALEYQYFPQIIEKVILSE